MKQGGSKEDYILAKRIAKRSVYDAKLTAEELKSSNLEHGRNDFVYKIAAQIHVDSRDVIADKCIKDDHGNLSVTTDAKKSMETTL